jgi:flavodoxin
MKYLVTYWSQTGNTKRVAEAIFDVLPKEKHIQPFAEVSTLDGFDLIFIGFPVMQFGPPGIVKKFLSTHVNGKKIALFITHAMFSNSEDPQQQAMLEKELENCRSACKGGEIAGFNHCQGELSQKTANELVESGIPMLAEFAAMRPLTIGHPDEMELAQAQAFARTCIATEPDQ